MEQEMYEALKGMYKLFEDMVKYVGVMALEDYQLLNEAPIKAMRAIKRFEEKIDVYSQENDDS